MRSAISKVVAITSVLVAACSTDRPEEHLSEAAEQLADAREETIDRAAVVAEELEDLRAERADVAEERAEVAEATDELRESQDRLEGALGNLAERADDVAIFRALQRSLLEEKELASLGIVALVDDRMVTLRGEVGDAEQRERAIEIARGTAGVVEVRDELTLAPDAAEENGAS